MQAINCNLVLQVRLKLLPSLLTFPHLNQSSVKGCYAMKASNGKKSITKQNVPHMAYTIFRGLHGTARKLLIILICLIGALVFQSCYLELRLIVAVGTGV